MHELLIGLSFVTMVFAPAVVASYSRATETKPE